MKKSAVIFNLLRAAMVVLAYNQITHPKSALIPPGTGRATAHYVKSCYHIAKSYLKGLFRRPQPERRLPI